MSSLRISAAAKALILRSRTIARVMATPITYRSKENHSNSPSISHLTTTTTLTAEFSQTRTSLHLRLSIRTNPRTSSNIRILIRSPLLINRLLCQISSKTWQTMVCGIRLSALTIQTLHRKSWMTTSMPGSLPSWTLAVPTVNVSSPNGSHSNTLTPWRPARSNLASSTSRLRKTRTWSLQTTQVERAPC